MFGASNNIVRRKNWVWGYSTCSWGILEGVYSEDVYHLRASSSKVSILWLVYKLLDHLRGIDAFINMALQFELSSARSPIFNIPRTSRRWWHRNEISDNYRWFYGVLGNSNDILSMTRMFGLKKVNDVIGTHSKMWEKLRVSMRFD